MKQKSKKEWTLAKTLPYLYVILGAIGFVAAFIIMFEKLHLLQDPTYEPSCSINPIISCGSVMSSPQGSAFGFPNPLIGLVGFTIVITSGMALLAGAKLKRWFWLGMQAGTIFGLGFIHWLFFQSVYNIGALCPYCIVVWMVTIPLFLYTTIYNFREGYIKAPAKLKGVCNFIQKHHGDILIAWYVVITVLILHHFWYYFGSLLS